MDSSCSWSFCDGAWPPDFAIWPSVFPNAAALQLIIFSPLILLVIAILGIATDIKDEQLQRAFGLSVQAWGPWLRDWVVNQFIMLIVGTIFIAILYFVIRRSPTRWWFYFWLASIPILIFILFFLSPLSSIRCFTPSNRSPARNPSG